MSEHDGDYPVGYGRPPKNSQFKPGQSGNPGGRPRKKETVHDVVQKFSEQKVWVSENGQKKQMTKLEVTIASLYGKASRGDVRASKLLLDLKIHADALQDFNGTVGLSREDSEALLAEIDWLAFAQKELGREQDDEPQ